MNSVLLQLRRFAALAVQRRAVCTLLVLATWRGPMPIVHAHSVGERDGFTDGQLIQHLRIFHWQEGPADKNVCPTAQRQERTPAGRNVCPIAQRQERAADKNVCPTAHGSVVRIGWHFHIALPWHSSCGDESDDSNSANDPLLTYGALTAQQDARDASAAHDASRFMGWLADVYELSLTSIRKMLPAPEAGAFQNSLAAQVSRMTLRAVTGVSIC